MPRRSDLPPASGPGEPALEHGLRQFVLKVHSRCNLACDYCYVYTMADQRWRSRPAVMSRRTITQAADRVAEHVRERRPPDVGVVLHGGEPLLAGPQRLAYCVEQFRRRVGDLTRLRFSLQTNGVQLDDRYLELFRELGVRIGVSLDGGEETQDRRRQFRNGSGSYAHVERALRRLGGARFRHLFAGILATIDLRSAPVATYQALLAFHPPTVDFLLPHGNWSAPPPGRRPGGPDTPYGDWLVAIFDRWYDAPRREVRIRVFEEIMNMLLGGASRIEIVGVSPPAVVVIETDGSIEDSGALNASYSGAAATGLHVARDPLYQALRLPALSLHGRGLAALSPICRACHLRRVCGGGMFAHRYHRDNGYANPSVYCRDLQRLIGHIHARMLPDVAAIRRRAGALPVAT